MMFSSLTKIDPIPCGRKSRVVIPPCGRVFLWLMCHNSILIEQQRHKRNLTDSDTCKRCNSTSETVLHCVRDWPMVLNNKRNKGIDLIPLINSHLRELQSVAKLPQNDPKIKNNQRCHIKWYPPSPGWIKFNVDRSHHNTTGSSACGGVARNENGNWLFGFSRRLGKRNAIYAEIRIREIAKDIWQVIFSHTLRESNKIADALPNHGHRADLDIVMFDIPPSWCSDLYQDDLSGLGLSRLVPC
ncbi:ribonuclease H [Senna tora]|uniref:Ribonuclease H n=1 Tax=Senna tora TaxID=362788 RepID=A0A834SNS3_9FABA|nr:ribonuclease H [Senna tora]